VGTWVDVQARDYPEPIVDHAEARKRALEALKKVTGK
jgi:deoxyribodipyrimidine photolyase